MARVGRAVVQNPFYYYVSSVGLVMVGIFILVSFSAFNSQTGNSFDSTMPTMFAVFAFVLAIIAFLMGFMASGRLDETGVPAEDRSIVDQLYVVPVGLDEQASSKPMESPTSDPRVQKLRDLRDAGQITAAEYDRRVRDVFFQKNEVSSPAGAGNQELKKDVGARLDQLKALRDAGRITEEDYQKRKEEIIREI
jgi:hypothetical protein